MSQKRLIVGLSVTAGVLLLLLVVVVALKRVGPSYQEALQLYTMEAEALQRLEQQRDDLLNKPSSYETEIEQFLATGAKIEDNLARLRSHFFQMDEGPEKTAMKTTLERRENENLEFIQKFVGLSVEARQLRREQAARLATACDRQRARVEAANAARLRLEK